MYTSHVINIKLRKIFCSKHDKLVAFGVVVTGDAAAFCLRKILYKIEKVWKNHGCCGFVLINIHTKLEFIKRSLSLAIARIKHKAARRRILFNCRTGKFFLFAHKFKSVK